MQIIKLSMIQYDAWLKIDLMYMLKFNSKLYYI